MPDYTARWIGIDITTTEMAIAVGNSEMDGFASIPMRGATLWNGDAACPGFELSDVAPMLNSLLEELDTEGWRFDQPGALSIACRQHDMVLLDGKGGPLLPALSWQCNAAVEQVEEMIGNAFLVEAVGRVEPRFILPKLAYVMETDAAIASQLSQVMTTGDWVLGRLCSSFRLSTSDALSNGLLHQKDRQLAADVMRSLAMDPDWFPEVAQSGTEIGEVRPDSASDAGEWRAVCERILGWKVIAGLGDNHASALGCGMTDDRTMVVSAGTSGTINLACPAATELEPVDSPAARFEFYRDHSLLLRMLPFCGDWYNRFVREYGPQPAVSHDALNTAAARAGVAQIQRISCGQSGEQYPDPWSATPPDVQIASVQYSICLELLLHVQRLLDEVSDRRAAIGTYVLTGGLSQSLFFQQVFANGIELLDPGKAIRVSGRKGPLRYKTSASGAMLNSRMPEWGANLGNIPATLFPLEPCGSGPDAELAERLQHDL